MSVIGVHGISKNTPENILLGAGTIHKNLVWDSASRTWKGEIIGPTSGGNSIEIKGEIKDIELDGALVKVKGLAVMQGGTATMEVNFAEISTDTMKIGMIGEEGESDAAGYSMIQTKANIEEGDYVPNFAFVGKTANGAKDIIVIMENALCTSGLKIEGKNKDNSVIKLTMEAYAENEGTLDRIPVKIYYPDPTAAKNA
ncbi:MAG: hypothetical protein J6B75_02195 [Ruminococcus sp.]|nr:hypothetical protein [Ruminococcus sp.]